MRQLKRRCTGIILCMVLCLAFTGCATKAGPAQSAGFVKADVMTKSDDLPFHSAWTKSEVNWQAYTHVYIADVHTQHILETSEWAEGKKTDKFKEEVGELARYTRKALVRAFAQDAKGRFQAADEPGVDTLVIELALTEVIPSSVVLGTLGYAPFGVGMAFKTLKSVTEKRSMVAFEARIKDGATGEMLAMFADREAEKSAPVNLNDVTWYGHAHNIVKEWAHQLARITTRNPGEVIKDSKPFTLKPW